MKKQSLAVLFSIFLAMTTGCTTILPAPDLPLPAAPPEVFSHETFHRVLLRHVDDHGRLDYTALAADTRDLDRYHRLMAAFSPDSHPQMFPAPQDRLAYWINAYNAATIKTVLNYYPVDSVLDIRPPKALFFLPAKSGFFLFQRQVLGKRKISLYGLENSIVRKRFIDPRYHFALNCASNGCPRLPAEAFTGRKLEMQLERETRAFLAEERNFKIDHTNRRIYLSAIFDWYAKDFIRWYDVSHPGRKGTLPAYIRLYLPEDKQVALDAATGNNYDIHFWPYDWGLNDQKKKSS